MLKKVMGEMKLGAATPQPAPAAAPAAAPEKH